MDTTGHHKNQLQNECHLLFKAHIYLFNTVTDIQLQQAWRAGELVHPCKLVQLSQACSSSRSHWTYLKSSSKEKEDLFLTSPLKIKLSYFTPMSLTIWQAESRWFALRGIVPDAQHYITKPHLSNPSLPGEKCYKCAIVVKFHETYLNLLVMKCWQILKEPFWFYDMLRDIKIWLIDRS